MLCKKSIFKAIRTEIPDTDIIEVVLRKRKTKKNKYSGFTAPFTMEETKELLGKYRDDIKRFNVSQNAISDKIDLLSDKFVNKVVLAKTTARTIDSEEMYKAIINFFDTSVVQYCNK